MPWKPPSNLTILSRPRKARASLQCVVGGLGACADKPHLLGARHRLDDALGELYGVGVLREEGRALPERLFGRFDDSGVGVPEHHWPGTQQVVDVFVAAHVPDARAAALAYDKRVVVVQAVVAEAPARQDSGGHTEGACVPRRFYSGPASGSACGCSPEGRRRPRFARPAPMLRDGPSGRYGLAGKRHGEVEQGTLGE